jgi:Periplasmic protease
MDCAVNGLLQSLDLYSSSMSHKIFDAMQTDDSWSKKGVGSEVSMKDGVVKRNSGS